ncbi:MAG TPA: NAD(P)H-binding protein [Gemmatimonadaceae bacterium]
MLSESGLDWLAVRPVTLVNGSPTGRAGAVDTYGLTFTVSRGDVAAWLVHAAERRQPLIERRILLGS